MWPLLGIFLLFEACQSTPFSYKEPSFLWNEANQAFQQKKYSEATDFFQQLINDDPTGPYFLASLLYLSKSLMAKHREAEAMDPLKDLLASAPFAENFLEASLLLIRLHLHFQHGLEATLLIEELEKKIQVIPVELFLLKTQACLLLHEDQKASWSLQAAQPHLQEAPLHLKQEAWDLDIQIQLKACARMRFEEPLQEQQALQLMERRGLCLIKMALSYDKIRCSFSNPTPMLERIQEALAKYRDTCSHPPQASDYPKLTASQRRQYLRELTWQLKKYYEKTQLEIDALLESPCSITLL